MTAGKSPRISTQSNELPLQRREHIDVKILMLYAIKQAGRNPHKQTEALILHRVGNGTEQPRTCAAPYRIPLCMYTHRRYCGHYIVVAMHNECMGVVPARQQATMIPNGSTTGVQVPALQDFALDFS